MPKKREPITYLIRSVWSCFTDGFVLSDGLAIRERLTDARDVITAWWKPCQHEYEKHPFPDKSGGRMICHKCGESYGIGEY